MNALGRIIRLPLRLVPKLVPLRILSGPLAGWRWLSTSSTHGCWLGTYESDLQREIVRNVKPTSVFYDIGANVGFFSLLACSRGATVVSFEPLPRNIDLLRRNLALNNAKVTLVEAAVADRVCVEHFTMAGPSQGSLGEGNLEVSVVALDGLQLPPPTHMKIDVEGAESRVLAGAKATIATHRPVIFLSTHGWEQQKMCGEILRGWGYQVRLRVDGSSDGQYEVVATPA